MKSVCEKFFARSRFAADKNRSFARGRGFGHRKKALHFLVLRNHSHEFSLASRRDFEFSCFNFKIYFLISHSNIGFTIENSTRDAEAIKKSSIRGIQIGQNKLILVEFKSAVKL